MKDKVQPRARGAERAKGADKARAKSSHEARAKSSIVPADQWLEHLEEEIEPTCSSAEKADLELVLANSPEDLETLKDLMRVRAAVKASDDVALPESGDYYAGLHSKIMSAIDTDIAMNGEPERQPKKSNQSFVISSLIASRKFPRAMFGAIGMTMMVAVVALVGLREKAGLETETNSATDLRREAVVEENFERKIAMVDSRSGAKFAQDMGSYESEEDFLTETAAARLKQVSAQQAEAMIRSLTR